ncbi:MAG: T9SS type A sorting domain-containing protein [Bacteroidota bacterium]
MKRLILFPFIFLSLSAIAQNVGSIQNFVKISDANGNLSDYDKFHEVKRIGDMNGDGVSDIAVGVPFDDDGGTDKGAVFILNMNADGTIQGGHKISDLSGNFTYPLNNGALFGYSLGTLGDLDGDGIPDLVVGSWTDDEGAYNEGAIWILFLYANGSVKSYQKINSVQGNFTGYLGGNSHFGISIDLMNDFNNDGYIEIAVGSSALSDGGLYRGAVWILSLTNTGMVHSYSKISSTSGGFTGIINDNDRFGRGVANIGDLDGDGVNDLAVGAIYDCQSAYQAGAVWILFLNSNGTVKSHTKICNNSSNFPAYLNAYDFLGCVVSSGVDITGDGKYELAVSSHSNDFTGYNRGGVWILSLNTDGTVNSCSLLCSGTTGFTGQLDDEDAFGSGLSFVPETSFSQRYNLSVGASCDDDGGTDRGAIYNIRIGPEFLGTQKIEKEVSFSAFPNPVSDRLNIMLSCQPGNEILVHINDITGRTVYQTSLPFPPARKFQLQLPEFSKGVYVLDISVDGTSCGEMKLVK